MALGLRRGVFLRAPLARWASATRDSIGIAPTDPPISTVSTPSGKVSFTDEKPADSSNPVTVVTLHGLPGNVRDFRYLAPALVNEGFRVIRLDLPGFGGTPWSCEPTGKIENRARVVGEVIDSIGDVGDFIPLGHSFGGPVAVRVSQKQGCIGVGLAAPITLRLHRGLKGLPRWIINNIDNKLFSWFLAGRIHQGFQRIGFKNATKDDVVNATTIIKYFRFDEHAEDVKKIPVPVMGMYAEEDPFIERELTEEFLDACNCTNRLVLPSGGHNIQKFHAVDIAKEMAAWRDNVLRSERR